jgi:hypothetical protein
MYLASQRYSGTEIKRREATIEIVPSASQRRPELGRKSVRQRQPLGAILVFERDRWEAVARNQDVRVNGALELPVIGDEKVRGRICEWFRYRVSPMLIRL